MADGIFPGPKGLRERLLALFAARTAAPQSDLGPVRAARGSEPHLLPPGMRVVGKSAPMPVAEIAEREKLAQVQRDERFSFFEDLKLRVRGARAGGDSLLAHDFRRDAEGVLEGPGGMPPAPARGGAIDYTAWAQWKLELEARQKARAHEAERYSFFEELRSRVRGEPGSAACGFARA